MHEILPSGNTACQLYRPLSEELRARPPADDDWRCLLESTRATKMEGEEQGD